MLRMWEHLYTFPHYIGAHWLLDGGAALFLVCGRAPNECCHFHSLWGAKTIANQNANINVSLVRAKRCRLVSQFGKIGTGDRGRCDVRVCPITTDTSHVFLWLNSGLVWDYLTKFDVGSIVKMWYAWSMGSINYGRNRENVPMMVRIHFRHCEQKCENRS